MRKRGTFDGLCALLAAVTDAVGFFGAFILAWWIRFNSGWIPAPLGIPEPRMYIYGSVFATLLYLLIYYALDLYRRPQTGNFIEKIPRLVRANLIGLLLIFAAANVIRTAVPVSRLTVVISFFTTCYVILLLRFLLFRLEFSLARLQENVVRVALIGTDRVAYRLRQGLEHDPRQRSQIVGFFSVSNDPPDPRIPPQLVRPDLESLGKMVDQDEIDEVIFTDMSLPREEMVSMMNRCEKRMVHFQMVPDMFRLLTSSVDVQNINGITVLGVGQWPLDNMYNRALKRTEDILGSVCALCLASPVLAVCAVIIKGTSPGPVFYRQTRCGEEGREFTIYKLRSMPVDAEADTGPVMTGSDDSRATPFGRFLRRTNLDELPQLWNVLRGDMSLVGPRPERPHFVNQFREDVGQYMWRHMYKPGLTGWAQVNGLRGGHTSIEDRIKYDLYYLENWSLTFDFKIFMRTLFARENAY